VPSGFGSAVQVAVNHKALRESRMETTAESVRHPGLVQSSSPVDRYDFGSGLRNGAIRSIGSGKMVVELFSDATSVRVCKKRSCNAIGC